MSKKLFIFILLPLFLVNYTVVFSGYDFETEYGKALGKTLDDVVKNIHAQFPDSRLTPSHVLAVMCRELPSLRIDKRNSEGRREGLMQVIDSTARALLNGSMANGKCTYINRLENGACADINSRVSNPRCSIEMGACLLNDILTRCNGDFICAVNEYNTGNPRKRAIGQAEYLKNLYDFSNGILCSKASYRPKVWQAMFDTVRILSGTGFSNYNDVPAVLSNNSPWTGIAEERHLQQQYQENPQSFWGSLLSKVGFDKWFSQDSGSGTSYQSTSGSSGSNNSIYKGDYFYQDDNSDSFSEDFSKSSSFDAEYENTQYDQGTLEPENSKYSDAFLHCLPSTLEKGEPFLISYNCPSGSESVETKGFESKTLKALLKMSAKESKLYEVSCKKPGVNINLKCQSKVIDPAILEFSIKPSNPNIGDLITVTWTTQDFKSCRLTNKDKSLTRSAISGEAVFTLEKDADKLTLLCETETGRTISKEIEI